MHIYDGVDRPSVRSTWYIYLLLFVVSVLAVFWTNRYAVDESLQFRQLANGWVSIYPEIVADPNRSFVEKFESVVEADIVHGRFRPAYFYYASVPYLLSPLVHGRLFEGQEKPWYLLMNGDLQLFSMMLLGTIAVTIFLFCALIYRYTGTWLFLIIPILFLPSAAATAENLLQNYIDSQEIPLMLWVALWFFSCFMALVSRRTFARVLWVVIALLALFLAFLTKETTLALAGTLTVLAVVGYFCLKRLSGDLRDRLSRPFFFGVVGSALFSVACAVLILAVVMLNKQGYATTYELHAEEVKRSFDALWRCLSRFTVHNGIYGYLPVGLAALLLVVRRKSTIAGIPVLWHGLLLAGLLLSCYGYLLILLPWKPVLVKYCYPSVVLFTVLVAYSLSLIAAYVKDYNKKILNILLALLLIPYGLYYHKVYTKADNENRYWFELANYGVSAVHELAAVIANEAQALDVDQVNVYIDLPGNPEKGFHVNWVKTQLRRSLNIDHGVNIVQHDGTPITNVSMPKGALSSFTYNTDQKNIFISQRSNDLEQIPFDLVFRSAASIEEDLPQEIVTENIIYQKTGKTILYPGRESFHGIIPNLDGFIVTGYVPQP